MCNCNYQFNKLKHSVRSTCKFQIFKGLHRMGKYNLHTFELNEIFSSYAVLITQNQELNSPCFNQKVTNICYLFEKKKIE